MIYLLYGAGWIALVIYGWWQDRQEEARFSDYPVEYESDSDRFDRRRR